MTRLASGGAVLIYQTGSGGPIYAQMLDAAGQNVGAPISVADNGLYATVAGLANGGFAVSWVYSGSNGVQNVQYVAERAFDASGVAFGSATTVSQGTFYSHADVGITALADGNFVVSWLQTNPQLNGTYTLKERTIDGAGTPLGAEVVVDSAARDSASLVLANGDVLVAYTTKSGSTPTVSFKTYDPAGSITTSNFPTITLGFDVTYSYLQLTELASGKILVSWFAQPTNTQYVLLGQIFDASGTATGDTFSLSTTNRIGSGTQIAALDDGNFVVTYSTAQNTVEAQVFDDHAAAVGSAFTVSNPAGTASSPVVTALGSNDFAVAWVDGAYPNYSTGLQIYVDVVNGTSGVDVLNGTAAVDYLRGLDGADTLNGLGGGDFLVGGAGGDTLDGGAGTDTAVYDDSPSGVTINLALNTASGGSAAGDTLISIENIVGSTFADVLTGDAGANRLEGGAGNDTLIGGAGADALIGGAGVDTADYSASSAGVTVNLTTKTGSGGDAQGDVLSEVENVRGSAFADVLTGDGAANVLEGLGGDDLLYGSADADTMDGGSGNDAVSYANSTNRVVVDLSSSAAQSGGDAQGDILISIENLIGSANDDILAGNGQINVLTGGGGNDIFKNTTAGFSGDTITDLSPGDTIRFTDANLANFTFTLAGSTLSYTGGSLTLQDLPEGATLTVAAAFGGGVELTLVQKVLNNGLSGDFNGDGRDDLVWRHDSGAFTNWLGQKSGGFVSNDANAFVSLPTAWHVAGAGDFNGDGRDDLIWRNDNGAFTSWLGQPSGAFTSNDANAFANLPTSWHVAGTGDFNGDGRDDIVWRNDNGAFTDWLGQASGGFVSNDANAWNNVPTSWHVVGTGDFNGDGRDDLIWRNDNGSFTEWLGKTSGGFTSNDANAWANLPTSWHVVGTGDFNGDGRDDIIWRNDNGAFTEWLGQTSGGFTSNDANAWTVLPASWKVAGTGDFNGDGRTDVAWRNDNGAFTDWLALPSGGFASNDANAWNVLPNAWQVQIADTAFA